MESNTPISKQDAINWLLEASRYFERKPSGGEDMAYWANVSNAATAKRIAIMLGGLDER